MLNVAKMLACTSRQAAAMAHHMCDPTAGPGLAEKLELFGVDGPDLAARSVARLRRDLDPRVTAMLEIGSGPLDVQAIAALLAGRTARGGDIDGLQHAEPQRNLVEALGLQPGRLPDGDDIAWLASGRLADGGMLDHIAPVHRLFALYGIGGNRMPTEAERTAMAQGRHIAGHALKRGFLDELYHRPGAGLSALLLSFSAPKGFSVAVALASTCEAAILMNAHVEAVALTMKEVDRIVGHVRRGDGGRLEVPAQICWLSFTHYTARPTGIDRNGVSVTDGGFVAGDCQIHDQVCLLTAALADDGRVGKLATGSLQHNVKALGSTYQMFLAAGLRRAGVAVSLDPLQDCVRLDRVPEVLIGLFSKRTIAGREKAEAFAKGAGLELHSAEWRLRTALFKSSTQGDPMAPSHDDLGDLASWHAQAAATGSRMPPLIEPRTAGRIGSRQPSSAVARETASERLAVAGREGRYMSLRTAAALGLIEGGPATAGDIARVAASLAADEGRMAPMPRRDGHKVPPPRALDGAVILEKAADGSASLVDGGRSGMIAAAVAAWLSRRPPSGPAMPVQVVGRKDVREVSAEVRRALQAGGELGQNVRSPMVLDDEGSMRPIPIAAGETIVFTTNVNGIVNGRQGRVGGAGGIALVTAVDDDGLAVVVPSGAQAFVRWRTLYDPHSDTMAIAHGYAALWPCRADAASVAAVLEGSAHSLRLGLPAGTLVLFDREAEIAAEGHSSSDGGVEASGRADERLWSIIAERLDRRARPGSFEKLEAARRDAERRSLMLSLGAECGTVPNLAAPVRRRRLVAAVAQLRVAIEERTSAFERLFATMPATRAPPRARPSTLAITERAGASTVMPIPPADRRHPPGGRGAWESVVDGFGGRGVPDGSASPIQVSASDRRKQDDQIPATVVREAGATCDDEDALVAVLQGGGEATLTRLEGLRRIRAALRRPSMRAALSTLLARLERILSETAAIFEMQGSEPVTTAGEGFAAGPASGAKARRSASTSEKRGLPANAEASPIASAIFESELAATSERHRAPSMHRLARGSHQAPSNGDRAPAINGHAMGNIMSVIASRRRRRLMLAPLSSIAKTLEAACAAMHVNDRHDFAATTPQPPGGGMPRPSSPDIEGREGSSLPIAILPTKLAERLKRSKRRKGLLAPLTALAQALEDGVDARRGLDRGKPPAKPKPKPKIRGTPRRTSERGR